MLELKKNFSKQFAVLKKSKLKFITVLVGLHSYDDCLLEYMYKRK